MALLQSILMALFVALVVYGAWSDARELRIPNWVSLSLLAAFVPMGVVSGIGLEDVTWHLAAGVAVLIAGFVLFALNLFGGGDAKLMAAAALWVGWGEVAFFLIAVVLVGGLLSVLVVLLRKGLGLWPDWLVRRLEGLFTPNKAVPYGIAIAAGVLITVPRMDVLPDSWRTVAAFIAG